MNVQELSFGSSKTLLVSLSTFFESKNVFNFKGKILIFAQLPSLTAIKDKNSVACGYSIPLRSEVSIFSFVTLVLKIFMCENPQYVR